MKKKNRVMTFTGIIRRGKFFNYFSYVNENGEEGEGYFSSRLGKIGDTWKLINGEWCLISTTKN